MIEYQTVIMTADQEKIFRGFMAFNILEEPIACMFAVNQYFYKFHELTEVEFIKIQEWEKVHVPINTP